MVMLPRNMISPMVSPSAGTGCMVSGSITVEPLLHEVAHALAAVAARARSPMSSASHSSCLAHTVAGP